MELDGTHTFWTILIKEVEKTGFKDLSDSIVMEITSVIEMN